MSLINDDLLFQFLWIVRWYDIRSCIEKTASKVTRRNRQIERFALCSLLSQKSKSVLTFMPFYCLSLPHSTKYRVNLQISRLITFSIEFSVIMVFSSLSVREDSQKGIYVDKLSRHIVTDVEDATKLYDKGVKSRYGKLSLWCRGPLGWCIWYPPI